MKALVVFYFVGFIAAAFRNAWRWDELREISFEEAFARTVFWPVCVLAALCKGSIRTIKGGFR